MIWLIVIVLVGVGMFLFFRFFTSYDHWSPKKGENLSLDAKFVSVTVKSFSRKKAKTTVVFSDGFKFVSYKSMYLGVEPATSFREILKMQRVKVYRTLVTGSMKEEIVRNATDVHDALIAASMGCTIDDTKWKCVHCGTVNANVVTKCISCGEMKQNNNSAQKVLIKK